MRCCLSACAFEYFIHEASRTCAKHQEKRDKNVNEFTNNSWDFLLNLNGQFCEIDLFITYIYICTSVQVSWFHTKLIIYERMVLLFTAICWVFTSTPLMRAKNQILITFISFYIIHNYDYISLNHTYDYDKRICICEQFERLPFKHPA